MKKKLNTTTKATSNTRKGVLNLEWKVPPYLPHRGFIWWSAALCIIFLVLLVLAAFQEWWVLIVAAPISCVVIIQNLKRQPESSISLTNEGFTVEYLGRSHRQEHLLLSDYTSFTTIEIPGDKRNASRWMIVLKPKKRLGLSGYAPAPVDVDEAVEIAERLEQHIPYVGDGGFVLMERFFARIISALGVR